MTQPLAHKLWGKTGPNDSWHPLLLHMLDVAACASVILDLEPLSSRRQLADIVGLPEFAAQRWLLLFIACHDLGKATPNFQNKRPGHLEELRSLGLASGIQTGESINHGFATHVTLRKILFGDIQIDEEFADRVSEAVGSHHGERPTASVLDSLEGNRRALGGQEWEVTRKCLFETVRKLLCENLPLPLKKKVSGPSFMLIAGLASFADWIGSNSDFFPFGTLADCSSVDQWWHTRTGLAVEAMKRIGWNSREPLFAEGRSFSAMFAFEPRPLQEAVARVVEEIKEPSVILIEAPMGEGKTEAAFYAHAELQRRFGHRGLYVALPTKATGNAMFCRTLSFLAALGCDRNLDLQLLHGATQLNGTFQDLRFSSISDQDGRGFVRASEWFTHKKRALLSEYGVGTIDQVLLPILPVKHQFVRLWGLANRVVVFDEIHAYDAYTGILLINLLRWLKSLKSSVILMSATLPESFRRELAHAVSGSASFSDIENYPRITVFSSNDILQRGFQSSPGRNLCIETRAIGESLVGIQEQLTQTLANSGTALAIVNTVQRAQNLYLQFTQGEPIRSGGIVVGKRLTDGTEVYLFHSRYPANYRQVREDYILGVFGKLGNRDGRKILIATQVVEQSLDLDFDVMVTDLAPIDLVLQRAGRLWRHKRDNRPVACPTLFVSGLDTDLPPSFGSPLWWNKVYREDLLIRTWFVLKQTNTINTPADIDRFVRVVYESSFDPPENVRARFDEASRIARQTLIESVTKANLSYIGLPDDASWLEPKFVHCDEDDTGIHSSLVAQTRLGDISVLAIPVFDDEFQSAFGNMDSELSRSLFSRAIRISRKNVVQRLIASPVPESWRTSPLLRNCFPFCFDANLRWREEKSIRLDDELGLTYQSKEST